jgi:hypothetical protein
MNELVRDLALWLLASPVYFIRWLIRMVHRVDFWTVAYSSEIACRCGAPISLVGMWRCGCGYTYRGHLLRACPVCSATPRMIRCFSCGATEKLPECD